MSNTKEILDSRDALHDRIEELEGELAGVHAGTHVIALIDPTYEMIHAAHKCPFPVVSDIYRAMLAASQEGEES